jgi:hypothetical protein
MRLARLFSAALVIVAADHMARTNPNPAQYADRPQDFSWNFDPGQRAPQPNGCAAGLQLRQIHRPDPDPNIRLQLMRDPGTGYSPL